MPTPCSALISPAASLPLGNAAAMAMLDQVRVPATRPVPSLRIRSDAVVTARPARIEPAGGSFATCRKIARDWKAGPRAGASARRAGMRRRE